MKNYFLLIFFLSALQIVHSSEPKISKQQMARYLGNVYPRTIKKSRRDKKRADSLTALPKNYTTLSRSALKRTKIRRRGSAPNQQKIISIQNTITELFGNNSHEEEPPSPPSKRVLAMFEAAQRQIKSLNQQVGLLKQIVTFCLNNLLPLIEESEGNQYTKGTRLLSKLRKCQ